MNTEITVRRDRPIPRSLRQALSQLEVGESFDYHLNTAPYRIARSLGIRVVTRKLNGGNYGVWRVK